MSETNLNELYLQNDALKSTYKELKREINNMRTDFTQEKSRMNRQMLEVLHKTKNPNDELKSKNTMLENSLKNIAENYVLIEKKVWNEQFSGVSNTNHLLEKICTLEEHIKVLENEVLEKKKFYNHELSLLK